MTPLRKWQIAWWEAQAEQQACRDCGREGSKAYVQPRIPLRKTDPDPGYALCTDCIGRINERIREEHKAKLDAEPRCEVDGCKRRGAVRIARKVLTCNAHYKRIASAYQRRAAGAGALALFLPPPDYSAAELLKMAET